MFPKRRYCILTFSDLNLKVISIDFASTKPKIIFYDQTELSPGIVFDDEIIDLIRFKEEVRKFLFTNEGNFESKKIILALNEQEVFFNKFVLKENPEKLKVEISNYLQTKLPYDIKTSTVHFKKISDDTYQLLSTKHQLIKDIAGIFENTNFELSKIELLPFACLNLLEKETEPYIFILSEDQTLQFALVIDKIMIFSASIKLSKSIKDSKEQFLKTIKKLVLEYEANKVNNVTLKNIFIVGQGSETISEFLGEPELSPTVVKLEEKFSGETSSDVSDYTKALLLGSAMNNSLSFTKSEETGISEKNTQAKNRLSFFKFSTKLYLIIIFGVLLSLVVFFIMNFSKAKVNKTSNTEKNSVATVSSKKKTVVSQTNPQPVQKTIPVVVLNKADVKIEVLNGTPTKGLASQTKTFLVGKGFNVVAVGNAANDKYEQTTIQIKPSKKAIQDDLTRTLSERYSIVIGDHLSENDKYDIIIILGRK
ncbi:MAG: LytR C-terminal domain-containing protein [Candidatus Magasanikbacteria bacterium]|nr:LytR C-terminal domain-containing protein [Candidatus Magasanikbacteria bacterium]